MKDVKSRVLALLGIGLGKKANKRIDDMPKPMVYAGTLGQGGDVTSLPTATEANKGDTYVVITNGTYDGQVANVGDIFVSTGTVWSYVPSGDIDTWRNIKVNGTEILGVANRGALDLVAGTNVSLSNSDGAVTINTNQIDDTLQSSTAKTWSVDKIGTEVGKATDLNIRINVSMNNLTATIEEYNTFDDFKTAINGKRPNVIFSYSILSMWDSTGGNSGWANCLSHGTYVGDVAISYEKTGEQLLHSNDYVFIGAVNEVIDHSYVYPEAPSIKTTLVKIVFKDSLTGTVTKLQDADAIAYSKNISGTWVADVKSALDTLDTKKANTSAIPTKTSDLVNDSGYQSVTVLSSTLTAGDTTLVFTNNAITETSLISVYADVWYEDIVVDDTTHKCTITFPVQSSNMAVAIEVK